jgi:flagellar hook-associated protein FlgK
MRLWIKNQNMLANNHFRINTQTIRRIIMSISSISTSTDYTDALSSTNADSQISQLQSQVNNLTKQLNSTKSDSTMPIAEKVTESANIQKEISQLNTEITKLRSMKSKSTKSPDANKLPEDSPFAKELENAFKSAGQLPIQ